ncbi:MAG: FAD-binding protein, partial [Nocardioidaceae bacterium]
MAQPDSPGSTTRGEGSTSPGGERHPMTGNRMDPGATEQGYTAGFERHQYDVVVVGAGGAGLRAAIAAHDAGVRVAVV